MNITTTKDKFGTTIVANGKNQVRIDCNLVGVAGRYEAYVDTFFPARAGCAIQYKSMGAAVSAAKKYLLKMGADQ